MALYLVATASTLSFAPYADMMRMPLYHHPAHQLAEMSERDRIIDLYPASPAALEFVQRSREEEEEEMEYGMLVRDEAPRVPSPIFANFVDGMDRAMIDYDGVDDFDAQMAHEAMWMADAEEAAWIAENEHGYDFAPYPPQHMGWQPPPGDAWMPMMDYGGVGFVPVF